MSDERISDHNTGAVGYGRPPVAHRFQKGQSGNPGGRPRRKKTLKALLGEALSRPSHYPSPEGTWLTKAEVIFIDLVGQACGPDLPPKKLLFDLLVKLQRADICWRDERLPEIELNDETAVRPTEAEIKEMEERMRRDAAARGITLRAPSEP